MVPGNNWKLRRPFGVKRTARTVNKVPCNDINGKVVSGTFERTMTFVIVTASDGRVLKANIDDSMFNPETLAKVLLLQLRTTLRTLARSRPSNAVPVVGTPSTCLALPYGEAELRRPPCPRKSSSWMMMWSLSKLRPQPLGLLRRYEGRARSRLLRRGYTTLRGVIRPMPEGPTIQVNQLMKLSV